MTLTEQYSAVAERARGAVDKSVEMWRQGTKSLTEQTGWPSSLLRVDIPEAVERYFEFLQQVTDISHQYASKLAAAMSPPAFGG